MTLTKFLPILRWGRTYSATLAAEDALAALIVTIMLIPQSLAYALLAGLPPEMGLYASILPLVAYAIFGTSNALAVGPVAVISLMTAAAIGKLGLSDPAQIIAAAGILAALHVIAEQRACIAYRHVRAHEGHPWNELADSLAKWAAKGNGSELPRPV